MKLLPIAAAPALLLLAAAGPSGRYDATTLDYGYGAGTAQTAPQREAANAAPGQFEPAPVPDSDIAAPTAPQASDQPQFSPSLFNTKTQFRGDGFSPGSTAQSDEEKNYKPVPGFTMKVPLTQW
ncbi:MAG TPA: hypothetical protein VME92_12400 [Acetobacteraceae bacterium]|nr:hypothetical protein [Acetobacteraceae bacterium]